MTDGQDDYSCVYLGVHALAALAALAALGALGLQVRDSHPFNECQSTMVAFRASPRSSQCEPSLLMSQQVSIL